MGYKYNLYLNNNNNIILRALTPNYFVNINSPTDVSYNTIFQVTGELLYPFPGPLNFYIYNQTVFYHQTTLPMLNGSFIFPLASISDNIPSGFVKILINWSSGYEFGMYEQLLCIHSTEDELSQINIITPSNIEIYQYDPFFVNLSLIKNGIEYLGDSPEVYFLIDDYFYPFKRVQGANYYLLINHLVWDAGYYNGTIIASDEDNFYAKNQMTITIYSADIDSTIENFPNVIYRNTDLNFRLLTFACSLEGGSTWSVPNVEYTIWINNTRINEGFTNSEGYSDVSISKIIFNESFKMTFTILTQVEGLIIKLQTHNVQISNDSLVVGRQLSTLTKISQTPVASNSTYFKIFNLHYPENAIQWYTVLEGTDLNPISAHLLRDDYTLEISIVGSFLIWNLLSDTTNNDIIVLEYSGPLTHYTIYEEIDKYSIQIECYSNYSINNYTVQLDLSFIEYPLSTISLLDFLKHNITDKFDIEIEESTVFLRNLDIISGIKTNYYLEVDIIIPTVEILDSLKDSYAYCEEIVGRWRFTSSGSFLYAVYFSVSGLFRSECMNTTLIGFSNDTYIVEAFLPRIEWNSTVSVDMELFLNHGVRSSSPNQNYSVTDPYSPSLSYFLDYKEDFIDLHLFPFEPELGSGIESISVIYGGTNYNVSYISDNHFNLVIYESIIGYSNLTVRISDQAGNIKITNIVVFDSKITSNEELSPFTIFPSLMAFIVTAGYLFTKFVKRRNNQIL